MDAVRQRVLRELEVNGHVRHLRVQIEIEDGEVILAGDVNSYYQKQMAQEVVKSVIDGRSRNGNSCPYLALRVVNNLHVRNGYG